MIGKVSDFCRENEAGLRPGPIKSGRRRCSICRGIGTKFENTGASAAPLKKPAHTQTQTPARFQSQTLTRTSARKPQRTATKDIDHTYKDLPLGNRAFALRMKCLEQKRKKQQEKENAFKSKPAKYREKRCTKNKKNNPSSNSTCESSSNN